MLFILLIYSCKERKDCNNLFYKVINNSIKVSYEESDNSIYYKTILSKEIHYNHFIEMYKDDTNTNNIKKHLLNELKYLKDTSNFIKNDVINFIKPLIKSEKINKVYISEFNCSCCEMQRTEYYIETEHDSNSTYYKYVYDFENPTIIKNIKKGIIANTFDKLLKYESTKTCKEKLDTSIHLKYRLPSYILRFEKDNITNICMQGFTNHSYKNIVYLSSRIDSLFYKFETSKDFQLEY
jgi:hypothetical protein